MVKYFYWKDVLDELMRRGLITEEKQIIDGHELTVRTIHDEMEIDEKEDPELYEHWQFVKFEHERHLQIDSESKQTS